MLTRRFESKPEEGWSRILNTFLVAAGTDCLHVSLVQGKSVVVDLLEQMDIPGEVDERWPRETTHIVIFAYIPLVPFL